MPTTSPKYPTGAATDIGGSGLWTGLTSGLNADDASNAEVTIILKNDDQTAESGAITFTTAEIPSDATINTVTLEWEDQTTAANGNQVVTPYLGATAGTAVSHASSTTLTARTADITAARPGGGSWAPADFTGGTLKVRVTADQPNNTTATTYRWDYVRVVVAYTVPVAMSTLTDDFAVDGTPDSGKWPTLSNSPTCSGGVLQLPGPASAGYVGPQSAFGYTITDSAAFAQLVTRPASFNGNITLLVRKDTSNEWTLSIASGATPNLTMRERVAGVADDTTVTWSATDHRWLKIAVASDNTVTWQTSPDGTPGSWTTQRTKAAGFTPNGSMAAKLEAQTFAGSAPTVEWDNFNIAAASATPKRRVVIPQAVHRAGRW